MDLAAPASPQVSDAAQGLPTVFPEAGAREKIGGLPTNESETVLDSIADYAPDDNDVVIDPRLRDYPISMVARTVHLHNDPR